MTEIVTPPQGDPETLPQETFISNETLFAFVDNAAAYVKTNAKEKDVNHRDTALAMRKLCDFYGEAFGTTPQIILENPNITIR